MSDLAFNVTFFYSVPVAEGYEEVNGSEFVTSVGKLPDFIICNNWIAIISD